MKKNVNKVPDRLLKKIKTNTSIYYKVGIITKIGKDNVEKYKHLGIKIVNGSFISEKSVLPSEKNGRYSKYNCEGRRIKRKDLPKIEKTFWGECYPYGNTNCDMVSFSYTKKVWQIEEWIPQYWKINISTIPKDVINDSFAILFEVNAILDKRREDFEEELLFAINLMQENIGAYEVYPADVGPSDVAKWEHVDWEFLPPGKIDETFIKNHFGKRSKKDQEVIMERYNYIQSLEPICMIKGTNYFSKYFGAKFSETVVVLENIESGNALFVFHQDWEELSKLCRSDLRKVNSSKVTRIIHNGNWKKKLEYEIGKA